MGWKVARGKTGRVPLPCGGRWCHSPSIATERRSLLSPGNPGVRAVLEACGLCSVLCDRCSLTLVPS